MPVFQDPGEPRRERRARHHARRISELRRLEGELRPRPYPRGDYILEPLPSPEFVGYVRSFVPNVAETHPLYGPLAELLPWVDREWIDTDKTFPASKKRRKRRLKRKTVQTLRSVKQYDLEAGHRTSLPAHLHALLTPAAWWLDAEGEPLSDADLARPRQRHYRVLNPDWYRLQTRRWVRTHRRVPSDAMRRVQSAWALAKRSGREEEVRAAFWGSWRWDAGEPLASRRSRDRAQEALDDLGVRPSRVRW